MVQFVFAHLPVPAVPGRVDDDGHLQIVIRDVDDFPEVFLQRRRIGPDAQVDLEQLYASVLGICLILGILVLLELVNVLSQQC